MSRLALSPNRSWLQQLGLVMVVLAMSIALSIAGHVNRLDETRPNTFLNKGNLVENVATPMSYYAIMAVGVTIVVITGGIDISVGSIMAFSAMITAWVIGYMPVDGSAWRVLPVAVFLPIAIGTLCGLLNGAMIVDFGIALALALGGAVLALLYGWRDWSLWVALPIATTCGIAFWFWIRSLVTNRSMHPFIVTLATMSILRGCATVWPPSRTMPSQPYKTPVAFTDHFMRLEIWDVRMVPLLIMILVTIAGTIFLRYFVVGLQVYAIGGNEEAARLSGLRVNSVKILCYALSGMCAGVAGHLSLGYYGSASATTALGYELTVVAAAVVGGASLSGGRGTAIGALLGALVLGLIENGISILQLKQDNRLIIVGFAILVAVAIDRMSESLSGKSRS